MTDAACVWFSTGQDGDETIHKRQRERIERWAKSNGHERVEWFEGGTESYQELRDSVDEYDVVVFGSLFGGGSATIPQIKRAFDIVENAPKVVVRDTEDVFEDDAEFVPITREEVDDLTIGFD